MRRVDDLLEGEVVLIGHEHPSGVATLPHAGDLVLEDAESVGEEGRLAVGGEDARGERLAVEVGSSEMDRVKAQVKDSNRIL